MVAMGPERLRVLCVPVASFAVTNLSVISVSPWFYARCAGLLREDATAAVDRAVRRRIVIAQAFYAGGAAL